MHRAVFLCVVTAFVAGSLHSAASADAPPAWTRLDVAVLVFEPQYHALILPPNYNLSTAEALVYQSKNIRQ